MGLILNKARNILYFLIIGWIAWIMERLREGAKAKEQVLIDNYELKKKDLESGVDNENLDSVISNTNKLYKPGSGNDSSSN